MSTNTITLTCLPCNNNHYNIEKNRNNNKQLVLRLKSKIKKVHWDENVIDNEHLKKWKCDCCCQFHKKEK